MQKGSVFSCAVPASADSVAACNGGAAAGAGAGAAAAGGMGGAAGNAPVGGGSLGGMLAVSTDKVLKVAWLVCCDSFCCAELLNPAM